MATDGLIGMNSNNFERILVLVKKGTLQPYQYSQLLEVINQFTSEILKEIDDEELRKKIKAWQVELRSMSHA
jgi:hypothetical protein